MRKTVATITRYDAGDGFYIEVEERLSMIEAWIWHKSYGIKYLFTTLVKSKDWDMKRFLQLVEANLPKYKEKYWEWREDNDY